MSEQTDPAAASRAAAMENANIPTTAADLNPAGDVPDTAADVVAWISEATDPAEARRRADAADAAENSRPGDNRSTVMDAIDRARQS